MQIKNRNCIITGAGSGIGAALSKAFADEGANVIVSDIDKTKAEQVAETIGADAFQCDVRDESQIKLLVAHTEQTHGEVDIFCSNAGLAFGEPQHAASASNDTWQTNWEIHVMSHVYAARAVLPSMINRGAGYFVNVASAAGLLSQIGDAAYTATKHAAVAFAESLAISHGSDGIGVSVICPQYVATPLLGYENDLDPKTAEGIILPDEVANCVIEGVKSDQFLILPHAEVHEYMQNKTGDTQRWISGMQRLRGKIVEQYGSTSMEDMHKFFLP